MKGFGSHKKSKNKKIKNLKEDNLKEQIINKAFKYHSEGNLSEATKYYQSFIKQGFKDFRLFSNYGYLLIGLGKLKEAELLYRKAIELKPDFAEAYLNLGNILINLDKLQEAELSFRKAIELKPDFADAHYNLGNILNIIGKLKEAELSFRKAIELKPDFADAYLNLGNILNNIGELQEAELSFRKTIELKPDYSEAYSNLGNILIDLGKLQEAEILYRKAIELKPNFAEAYLNLGNILNNIGELQEAELSFRKAIEIKPNYTNAYFNLFRLHEQTNNLEKLRGALNKFNNIEILKNELLLFRARLSFRDKQNKTAQELINCISPFWLENSNVIKKNTYWSYKAFIEDKVGNYDIAFSCFEKSQDNPSYLRFNKNSYLNFINSYKKNIINKKTIFYNFNDDIKDSNLAFLVGFPRSGTTLLDTILRSHKDIEVIEEKPLLLTIENLIKEKLNTQLDNIFSISENNSNILRKKYFELLREYTNTKDKIILDKMPLHTSRLPLIKLLFPNAKIIFTHRHPYDTVLSCFQQSFKPNQAMANLVSLKSSSIMYDQVMKAWVLYKENLSLNFISSKYENLIDDFDTHIKKLLEFLEIEWDKNVQNYRETALKRRRINTPSSSQVVQPLYDSSIEKWKNYKKYYKDCHQYLEKWVAYFDYL